MRGLILIFFYFVVILSHAQDDSDALRYSQNSLGGTAKYNAMAGSFGALGGEMSALGTNPAGIGIFRKTELSASVSVLVNTSRTTHFGNQSRDFKTHLNVPHIGLVATYNIKSQSNWKTLNFGFNYSSNTSFQSRSIAEGINNNSSLLDLYKNQLAQDNLDPCGSELAWNTYLIDTLSNPSLDYYTAIPNYGQNQRNTVLTKGSLGETNLTFGANYNNRLYLGATLGMPSVDYTRNLVYTEEVAANDTTTDLKSFTLSENLTTTGSGVNFKVGIIYRIHDIVRVGAAVHTPSLLTLTDDWSSALTANYKTTSLDAQSPIGQYDYTILTPMKALGSIGFVIGKLGLLNIEYEHIDYSTARLSSSGASVYAFSAENKNIQQKYRSTGNIRTGTEWRVDKFRIRAGYAHYGNPFKNNLNDYSVQTLAFGLGYKSSGFYVDFSYSLSTYQRTIYLYDAAYIEGTKQKFALTNVNSTIGFRF